jgi:hypothetical protein
MRDLFEMAQAATRSHYVSHTNSADRLHQRLLDKLNACWYEFDHEQQLQAQPLIEQIVHFATRTHSTELGLDIFRCVCECTIIKPILLLLILS